MSADETIPAPDPRFARPRTLFFGIGAQRCGTTWLHRYLSAYPEIHLPPRKELHFWNILRGPREPAPRKRLRDLLTGSDTPAPLRRQANEAREIRLRSAPLLNRLERFRPAAARRRLDRLRLYAALYDGDALPFAEYADVLFMGYEGQPVAGEITPAYARLSAETFAEMAALASDVRFVYVMRDPAARLVSGIRQRFREQGRAGSTTTERVLARARAILADPADVDIERSRYDMTIGRLESAVSPGQIHYAFYEELFTDAETARLCRFLGVAPRPAPLSERVNAATDAAAGAEALLEGEARAALAPVYAFVEKKFGRLPEAWRG